MKHRVFDDEFKKMAVELSKLKNSVKDAAEELGLDASRLSEWRNNPQFNGGKIMMDIAGRIASIYQSRTFQSQRNAEASG